MCYPKPGPRCASHTRNDIKEIEKELALDENSPSLQEKDKEAKKAKLRDLYYDYYGTRTGQHELDDRITNSKSAAQERKLVDLKDMTKVSYDEKLKAYKVIAAELKKQTAADKARIAAEAAAEKKRQEALSILDEDSKKNVKDQAKKLHKPARQASPTVKVVAPAQPQPYSSYSYRGKGGGKY